MLKLAGNGIIVIALLMIFSDASFLASLFMSVILSALAYTVGDQYLLRRTSNAAAAAADAVLAFVFFWAVGAYAGWSLSFLEIFVIAVVLGMFEFFLHVRMMREHTWNASDTEPLD
ncbi:DUF2512 family protein [Paenibacillus aurantius]|uniref:DUF2512 family protein n=1 Tax=Paenibacillus aurantius TaxID=2918900 RepID=A0AA96RI55_9BACL|nr:DUF2512 family protein [Paenibacillus aurantius]WNQ11834.1 DUF2512 family protein [Paenibacillus aurantius]